MRRVTIDLKTPWAETLEAAARVRGMTLEALAAAVLRRFAEGEARRERGEADTAAAATEAALADELLLAEEPPSPYGAGPDDPKRIEG